MTEQKRERGSKETEYKRDGVREGEKEERGGERDGWIDRHGTVEESRPRGKYRTVNNLRDPISFLFLVRDREILAIFFVTMMMMMMVVVVA